VGSVLIVDDEPRIREFLARWLAQAGYDIREAPDAETALTLVDQAVPDVVLCDVQMPGHDGLWLVEQLRQRFGAVAVILATADATVPPAQSLKSNVVHYLVKPFDKQRLLAATAEAMEWRKAAVARARTDVQPLTDWLDKE
jgi:DNA-binding NtrC family response regulator